MNTIQKFEFNGQLIDFEVDKANIMVNATQMAKVFGKRIDVFLKSENTQAFINELQFTPYGGNSTPLNDDEIVKTRGHLGTFMHDVLALKFAAWLNPKFELWVFYTIKEVLFAYYQRLEESLKKTAAIQKQIEELENKLTESPEYLKLKRLEFEDRQIKLQRAKENRNQLELFKAE